MPSQLHIALSTLVLFLQLACTWSTACAQTSISGVVNTYTPVGSIVSEGCNTFMGVEDTVGFSSGDRVLIFQASGCSDSAGYDVDAVGLWELGVISNITANNTIVLDHPLLHSYKLCGAVQLVRVASFTGNVRVQDTLRVAPWNGRSGGVLCVQIKGSLQLAAPIDVRGAGFAGGALWNGSGQCSTTIANAGVNHADAAAKGTSFVNPRPSDIAGGAALFSGGGGGLGHNSGGGGGGNTGNGGNGGAQWQGCGQRFDNGGRGGGSFAAQRGGIPLLRFGGGGGAGHMNNQRGTSGASGGGIVLIIADSIISSQPILAYGSNAATAGNDGAGGGGAGGCVVIDCSAFAGTLSIHAEGGTGGDVTTGDLHGPGGGGGGGAIFFSSTAQPDSAKCFTQGGSAGRCVAYSDTAIARHLAGFGSPGGIITGSIIPQNLAPVRPVRVAIIGDSVVCAGTSHMLTLDLADSVSSIFWSDFSGTILGDSSSLIVTPLRASLYIVTVRNNAGCTASDTLAIDAMRMSDLRITSRDLDTVYCATVIDTTVWFVNTGNASARITSLQANSSFTVIDSLPIVVQSNDSALVRVRLTTNDSPGRTTIALRATVSPCDSILLGSITWWRARRITTALPGIVRMPDVFSCSTIRVDTMLMLTVNGHSGIITSIISEGAVSTPNFTPLNVRDGVPFSLSLQWTPSRKQTQGRVGLILHADMCDDTLWVSVDGTARLPRMSAPDTIRVNDILLCKGIGAEVRFTCASNDSTLWQLVKISAPDKVQVDRVAGDSAIGSMSFLIRILPKNRGAFVYAVDVTFAPCDTTLRILLSGTALDAALTHDDSITIVEPVVGRNRIQSLPFINTGTTPLLVKSIRTSNAQPFRIITTVPGIPCTLQPSDSLTCFVELTQRYGEHRDTVIVSTDNPCTPQEQVLLRTNAAPVTRLLLPDIFSTIGSRIRIPIILEGRPAIEPWLLDSFALDLILLPEHLRSENGSDATCRWQCSASDTATIVHVIGKWDGSDTLATLPALTLLSSAESTPLRFLRSPGCSWLSQPCNFEYRDGSIVFADVCGGRALRLSEMVAPTLFTLTPNPASEHITITPQGGISEDYEVRIYSGLGQELMVQRAKGSTSIDIHGLPTGVYAVHITLKGISVVRVMVKE